MQSDITSPHNAGAQRCPPTLCKHTRLRAQRCAKEAPVQSRQTSVQKLSSSPRQWTVLPPLRGLCAPSGAHTRPRMRAAGSAPHSCTMAAGSEHTIRMIRTHSDRQRCGHIMIRAHTGQQGNGPTAISMPTEIGRPEPQVAVHRRKPPSLADRSMSDTQRHAAAHSGMQRHTMQPALTGRP